LLDDDENFRGLEPISCILVNEPGNGAAYDNYIQPLAFATGICTPEEYRITSLRFGKEEALLAERPTVRPISTSVKPTSASEKKL
jgi:hypothetical protein